MTKTVLFSGHKGEFVEVGEEVEQVDPTVHCRPHLRRERFQKICQKRKKLDGVGLVDNRPSTD